MTPTLLRRFPRLRPPMTSAPVLPPEARSNWPALVADFDVLDAEVAPAFQKFDRIALAEQNRYRLEQMLVAIGSALMIGLGGLQAVESQARWPGIVLGALGIVLAGTSRWSAEQSPLTQYLDARVKAERLRSLHFQYLGRIGRYTNEDRVRALRHAVIAIEAGKELE